MERDNRLKRARDAEGDQHTECHVDKKLETITGDDGFGVFDFPWLKEGGFAAADEFLEPHDVFPPPCLGLGEIQGDEPDHQAECANADQSCMQRDDSWLVVDQDLLDCKFDVGDLDCVWASVVDQPLDVNICVNKA